MNILVTGGAGFIGSHITDFLIKAGHTVAIVDNLQTGKRENVHPDAGFYHVDIRDREEMDRVFSREQPQLVSHQAALTDVRGALLDPITYAEVNIIGSINLLELARRHGVRRIVYASTGGALYGEPQQLPVPLDHPINPLDPYGASKHAVEHYLALYKHNYGLDYVTLRYPNVYGPRQDHAGEGGVVAIFTASMLGEQACTINGDGTQQRDFLYVSDVAKANLLALDRGDGIYNIGTGRGTDINTVFALLKKATGYDGVPVYGPAKPGEVHLSYLDASRARADLGWAPYISLQEGLQRTVDHFRQVV